VDYGSGDTVASKSLSVFAGSGTFAKADTGAFMSSAFGSRLGLVGRPSVVSFGVIVGSGTLISGALILGALLPNTISGALISGTISGAEISGTLISGASRVGLQSGFIRRG
jgi:hypothetical protein